MIGMSIKGLEAFLPKASGSVRGCCSGKESCPSQEPTCFSGLWTVDSGVKFGLPQDSSALGLWINTFFHFPSAFPGH